MKAPSWCGHWENALRFGLDWIDGEAFNAAVAAARPDGVALDGGAHIGAWSVRLAARFRRVIAWEPCDENAALFAENAERFANVELRRAALGAAPGTACLRMAERGGNSGQWAIGADGQPVTVETIDGLALDDVSLIKLDLEGYELPALVGARETVRRCRPVIVCEERGWERLHGLPRDGARAFLIGFGYRVAFRGGGDVVFVPAEHTIECGSSSSAPASSQSASLPTERLSTTGQATASTSRPIGARSGSRKASRAR